MKHFNTLSSYLTYVELPPPEHPMLRVFSDRGAVGLPCPKEAAPPITSDCYSISLKKAIKGRGQLRQNDLQFYQRSPYFGCP